MCRYFLSANGCWKGNECRYSHNISVKKPQNVPMCRNGTRCFYLANRTCKFGHNMGAEVQNQTRFHPRRPKMFCKYVEDCLRVPNCPYIHSMEDFPELSLKMKPPVTGRGQ